MNLAKLNHILIPGTKAGRDRLRDTRAGRLLGPLGGAYRALTQEGQFLSIFWMVCGSAGLEVGATQIHLLWCLITGVMVAALLHRRRYRLDGVRLTAEAPGRLTAGDVGSFVMRLSSERPDDVLALRVIGPLLPWDGAYVGDRPGLARLPAGGVAAIGVRVRFRQRGEHHLDPFYVARVVPLGLTMGPALETDGVRFLVMPRPARIGALDLPLAARFQPGGVTVRGYAGESREFVGVRPYRPGDAIRDLHARSSARAGYPVVREYRQEYFTRVGVVLDTDVAAADEATFEAAISVAAAVLDHVSRGEALIDLLVLGERVHRLAIGHLAPGHYGTLGSVQQAHELLACVAEGPAFDAAGLSGALAPHLTSLSCVVFVGLTWDAPRRAAVEALRHTGTAVKTLVLGGDGAADGAVRIDPADVVAQRPLHL